MSSSFKINKTLIGNKHPTYFIADIAANHDGNLGKAIELIHKAKEAGANAAKFQHFKAETIVSNKSFLSYAKNISHQSKWKKVFLKFTKIIIKFELDKDFKKRM